MDNGIMDIKEVPVNRTNLKTDALSIIHYPLSINSIVHYNVFPPIKK